MNNAQLFLAGLLLMAMPNSVLGQPVQREIVKGATVEGKAEYHVVFTETIDSKTQSDWKDTYTASVKIFVDEHLMGTFKGSTLPNALPGAGRSQDYKYSVTQASCAFPGDLKGRYYTWKRVKRSDGKRPCLRLAASVPTVEVSSARISELNLLGLANLLHEEVSAGHFAFATNVLVHEGESDARRGSAGCLTISPADAEAFFNAIPDGVEGTMELNRGLEDEETRQSYCY